VSAANGAAADGATRSTGDTRATGAASATGGTPARRSGGDRTPDRARQATGDGDRTHGPARRATGNGDRTRGPARQATGSGSRPRSRTPEERLAYYREKYGEDFKVVNEPAAARKTQTDAVPSAAAGPAADHEPTPAGVRGFFSRLLGGRSRAAGKSDA
jgi:hypothetical protein